MDHLEAIEAFVVTVEQGSLSAAARTLGRSAASVTRAVAALEARLGVPLLRRTTRSMKLTEAGESYVVVGRRVLAELADAEKNAAHTLRSPHGLLTITAPVMFGALHVVPVVDAYLAAYPDVRARLLLLDRVAGLVDEGIDVAIRIAHLPDSSLVATPLGFVRRVVCASPRYLARHGRPRAPSDLARHRCIALSALTASDTWTFGPGPEGGRARHVKMDPVLTVNTAEAAIAAAVRGVGVTCALSYQVAGDVRAGRLVPLLVAYEPARLPVHIVFAQGSAASARVRTFVELAAAKLRAALAAPAQVERARRSAV